MNKISIAICATALALSSSAILPCPSVAGTTFARDALMPCVEKRGVAGVVSILYANGVKELNTDAPQVRRRGCPLEGRKAEAGS